MASLASTRGKIVGKQLAAVGLASYIWIIIAIAWDYFNINYHLFGNMFDWTWKKWLITGGGNLLFIGLLFLVAFRPTDVKLDYFVQS